MMSRDTIKAINKAIAGGKIISEAMIDSSLSSYHYYETLEEQIASVFRGLVKNHAFYDGNKRTGLIALLTLAEKHDLELNMNDDELANLTIDVAKNNYDVSKIAGMIFK